MIMGIDIKNENLTLFSLLSPEMSPAQMLVPLRLMPGSTAKQPESPIAIATFSETSLLVFKGCFCPKKVTSISIPESRKPKPKKPSENKLGIKIFSSAAPTQVIAVAKTTLSESEEKGFFKITKTSLYKTIKTERSVAK